MKRFLAGLLIAALSIPCTAGTVFAGTTAAGGGNSARQAEAADTGAGRQTEAVSDLPDYPDSWDPEDPLNERAYQQIYGNRAGISLISNGPLNGVTTQWGNITYTHNDYNTAGRQIVTGIDVSYHNKEIDWNQVKNSGIEYAIIRAGYRGLGASGTLNKDPLFDTYIQGAQAAGLKVGVYFFSQAITREEAVEEAQYTLQIIQGYHLDLPVCFDYEYSNYYSNGRSHSCRLENANLSKTKKTNFALAFCDTVAAAGYQAMIYSSSSWFAGEYHTEQLTARYPLWMARYNTYSYNPDTESGSNLYGGRVDMWQCTSRALVAGIGTNVDLDYWYQAPETPAVPSVPAETPGTPGIIPEALTVIPTVWQNSSTAQSLEIGWTPVSGVTGYQIQYSNKRQSGFQTVDVEGAGNSVYTLSGLLECREYYVQLRSYIRGADGTVSYSQFTPLKTMTTEETIATKALTKNKTTMRELAGWQYRKLVNVPQGVVLRVKRIAMDETHSNWYKVSYTKNGVTHTGYIPKADTKEYVKKASGLLQSGSVSDSITMTWNTLPEASGYLIYRASAPNGTFKQIAQIRSGSTAEYVNKNRAEGTEYYYKLRAYKVVNGNMKYGEYTSVKSFHTKALKNLKVKTTSSVNLREKPGTGYKALKLVPRGKTFSVIYKTKDKNGKTWYKVNYKVNQKTYTGYIMASYAKKV